MYIVTVLLKTSPHLLQFHFDQFKDANAAMNKAFGNEVEDDYGSKAK